MDAAYRARHTKALVTNIATHDCMYVCVCVCVSRCREAGIEEFIVKPFRVEDLKRVVQSYSRPQSCAPHAAPAGDTTTPPNTSNSLLGNRTVTAS